MGAVLAIVFIIGLYEAFRHAARSQVADYRKSRDAKVKEAGGKRGKGSASSVKRSHATGYWGGELLHGFPVWRTGLHAGWLAHKKASAEEKALREKARTDHEESSASLAEVIREHKRRQEAARKRAQGEEEVTVTADDPPLPSETVGGPTRRVDGQPETESDKRFFDERESGYEGPLDQDGNRPDMSDPEMAGAVRTLDDMRERSNGSKPPATEGGPMPTPGTADVTYEQLITEADKIITEAEQELATIQQSQLGPKMESAAALLNDNNSLSNAAEVDEALRDREKAAQRVLDAAQAFKDGLQRDHGGINDAVADAPIPMAAQPEFYGE
jgi:hypothetical protein